MSEIIYFEANGAKAWVHKVEYDKLTKFCDALDRYRFYFWRPEHAIIRESREKPQLCFAYFIVGSTQKLCYTTKEKPSQAYKIDKNYKQTYEVWKQAKFIRYCTSMDL